MKLRNPFNIHETMTGVFNENTAIRRENNQIDNVCMIRSISKNNRYYTPEALDSLVNLGKRGPIKAFIDHDTLFQGQSVLNLLGEFSGLRRHDDAVYADLTVFESSKGKDLLFDLAENHPHAAGFSINARGKFEEEPDSAGREVVKEIVAIRSCDFVGEPATTYGVFEQELPDSCFAYVDHDTRLFPYKDLKGAINIPTLKHAIESEEIPDELKIGLREELETAEASVRNVGEPYTMANPPAVVKNLPSGAQRIFIDVFNRTYAETKDDSKSRQAAWGAVKNKYKKTASGKWVRASEGGETMDRIMKFFEDHVAKWSTLTDEGKEEAALEYLHSLLDTSDQVGEQVSKIGKLEGVVAELTAKVDEVSSQLAEAQAKVDAYETKERESAAKQTRIELIAKITKEQELGEEAMSETFKNILMTVSEDKIEDLVKDRKTLLQTGTSGVTDSGHEQTTEEKVVESEEKKKKFYEELSKNL